MRKARLLDVILSWLLLCLGATAGSSQPPLPADIALNPEAGRGGHLIVKLRLETGEELPFIVDTGSPVTFIDKSLESKLGERLGVIRTEASFGGQESGIYRAAVLYSGSVPLMTDQFILTLDFKQASALPPGVRGILGMDCLRHYCIQLDFAAGKLRFLDPGQLEAAGLGKGFPIVLSGKGQRVAWIGDPAGNRMEFNLPFIQHAGLGGGTNTDLLIDSGYNNDGVVPEGSIKGHYLSRLVHFFIRSRDLRVGKCDWDGETYTKLRIGTGTIVFEYDNVLGLRFLARHLVTFDFPNKKMYFTKICSGPLPAESKSRSITRAPRRFQSPKLDSASGGRDGD